MEPSRDTRSTGTGNASSSRSDDKKMEDKKTTASARSTDKTAGRDTKSSSTKKH